MAKPVAFRERIKCDFIEKGVPFRGIVHAGLLGRGGIAFYNLDYSTVGRSRVVRWVRLFTIELFTRSVFYRRAVSPLASFSGFYSGNGCGVAWPLSPESGIRDFVSRLLLFV